MENHWSEDGAYWWDGRAWQQASRDKTQWWDGGDRELRGGRQEASGDTAILRQGSESRMADRPDGRRTGAAAA
jgi:hypothetical protein